MRVALLVLALACAGCMHAASPLSPLAPELAGKAPPITEDPDTSTVLRIVAPAAVLEVDALRVSARIFPAGYGSRWVAMVLLDVDRNASTGYRYATGGAEFVALADDRAGGTALPIRWASVTGFGDVAGFGTINEGGRVTFEIPLKVIGPTDGVRLRLVVAALAEDGSESGAFRLWDAVALAPVASR